VLNITGIYSNELAEKQNRITERLKENEYISRNNIGNRREKNKSQNQGNPGTVAEIQSDIERESRNKGDGGVKESQRNK
jgi:hypothetical protein